MILIDALYIHNGGGKVLLDYLVEKIEHTTLSVFYLFDNRLENNPYQIKGTNKTQYMKASLIKRSQFYKKYDGIFKTVFILGNIPPLSKSSATVITYFHNLIYISVPNDFKVIDKIKYKIKVKIIKCLCKNTDSWLVQSETVKNQFISKYGSKNTVDVLPFFPEFKNDQKVVRKKETFLYVSNAQANKNHKRLIEGFCKAYDKTKKGKLTVTVNNNFPDILKLIKKTQISGYPIENVGFVDRETLTKIYLESEYVVFPSLSESFGLGIIEGISMGCNVIGADLPYTYAVCTPSLTFDPLSISGIRDSIIFATDNHLKNSILKVKNEINKLLRLLEN